MPSLSKAQQRLMGQAYALKKGYIELADIKEPYRDSVKDLSKMKTKSLESFAKTKHEGLPDKVIKEDSTATVSNVNGMGSVNAPGDPGTQKEFATQKTGSGDSTGKPKKRILKKFKQFIEEE